MHSAFIARVHSTDLGGQVRSYDELRALASNYARQRLAGLTVVNYPTQLAITLGDDGLKAATSLGTPARLLMAIPALPAMLSYGRYVSTFADPLDRRDVRRLHIFAAEAAITNQHAFEVRLVSRENFNGQCFLDQLLQGSANCQRRDTGGWVPDNATAAPESAIPADAEADSGLGMPMPGPGTSMTVAASENSDGECWRRCQHLVPSPSGDLQASEFRRCWRLCKGTLSE
jgi:hypothetical protein